jgi:hypothetical protein
MTSLRIAIAASLCTACAGAAKPGARSAATSETRVVANAATRIAGPIEEARRIARPGLAAGKVAIDGVLDDPA